MTAPISNKVNVTNISPSERVFQLNRDTYLIYVGLHSDDANPFIRIGSGELPNDAILKLIKHIVIPEVDTINIGQEMEWVNRNILLGGERPSYIGLDEHIRSAYRFASIRFQKKSKSSFLKKAEAEPPIEIQHFGPPAEPNKNHVIVNQLGAGNFTVLVGKSRVFDYKNILRGQFNYEREFNLISELFSKQPSRLNRKDKRSFLWFGSDYSDRPDQPFVYWNLKGVGALLNPSLNYHLTLFQEKINPSNAKIFLSGSGQSAGVSEGIKNLHTQKKELGLYLHNDEILSQYKHLYPNANIHLMHDGNHVPIAKSHNFYVSKSNSHAALSWSLATDRDEVSQIIFPFGEKQIKRVFNVIRAPHDIEFQVIHNRLDLKNSLAHLSLQIPGNISKQVFDMFRIKSSRYPLVPKKEYIIHEGIEPKDLVQPLLVALHGSPYFEILRNFLTHHLSQEMESNIEKTSALLKDIQSIKIPLDDIVKRNNLYTFLVFISNLSTFQFYTKFQKIQFRFLKWKYNPVLISYKSWLLLEQEPVEFHLLLLGGNKVYQFVKFIQAELLQYKIPPSLDFIETNYKHYPNLLKNWYKTLDRYTGDDSSSYKNILDLLQKFYEERLRLVSERLRLYKFIGLLNLGTIKNQEKAHTFFKPKNISVKESFNFVKELLQINNKNFRNVLFIFFLLLGSYGIIKGIGGLFQNSSSKWGDKKSEIAAVSLVRPGTLQKDSFVPGEDKIEVPDNEISKYVNALAKNNKFLIGKNGVKLKKSNRALIENNLDLVFPGDVLRLPDLRQTNVTKGDHVWEIARIHYRKDFARMKILQKQIQALINKKDITNVEVIKTLTQKQQMLKRLAVTPLMKKFESQTRIMIKEKLI